MRLWKSLNVVVKMNARCNYMSVKDKLIDLYMEVAWDIVLRPELTNKQKIRILNNIIHDDIPSVEMLDKAGVW